jgi:uncharacterized protein (TIGR03032 family)
VQKPSPPFACRYSANFPELLNGLNCTIALSTYQAGKLVFISAQDDEKVIQLPRTFRQAMAIGMNDERMAVATKDEVVVLVNSPALAPKYPQKPDTYDGFFVPRAMYCTGRVDIHGLAWGNEGLWAVVTSFSCLALINDSFSFIPKWKPSFITELVSEDRCHLNGMAMHGGSPEYVTALGSGDEHQSWRKKLPKGGLLIHVPTGEVILNDLSMPHSPRLYDGKLYMLLSATGEVVCVDTKRGAFDVINKLNGFVRGMAKHDDYLFVCLSRLRKNSSTFKDLPIAEKATNSGVTVIHLPTGGVVGKLTYEASVDEIFDIQIVPNYKRPGILNTEGETHKLALTTPEATYWGVVRKASD